MNESLSSGLVSQAMLLVSSRRRNSVLRKSLFLPGRIRKNLIVQEDLDPIRKSTALVHDPGLLLRGRVSALLHPEVISIAADLQIIDIEVMRNLVNADHQTVNIDLRLILIGHPWIATADQHTPHTREDLHSPAGMEDIIAGQGLQTGEVESMTTTDSSIIPHTGTDHQRGEVDLPIVGQDLPEAVVHIQANHTDRKTEECGQGMVTKTQVGQEAHHQTDITEETDHLSEEIDTIKIGTIEERGLHTDMIDIFQESLMATEDLDPGLGREMEDLTSLSGDIQILSLATEVLQIQLHKTLVYIVCTP